MRHKRNRTEMAELDLLQLILLRTNQVPKDLCQSLLRALLSCPTSSKPLLKVSSPQSKLPGNGALRGIVTGGFHPAYKFPNIYSEA